MKLSPQLEKFLPACLWIIPLVFFGYVIFRYTAINGAYVFIWTPGDKAEYNLQPIGRVSKPLQAVDSGEIFQRVTGDPVYLDISVPRSFDSVTATVDLYNNGQPLIELGLQDNEEAWHFDFHPLDVPLLDNLNWFKVTDGKGNTLFQKQPPLTSQLTIQDFLDDLPLDKRIAEYHQNLQPPYVMTDYVSQPALDIDTPLRGPQLMKLYAKDQIVSVDLTIQDLNRAFDDDSVTASLIQAGQILSQTTIGDDGDLIADGKISNSRFIHLATTHSVTGLIELQIESTDDVLINEIKTTVGYLVTRQLYVAGNTEYGFPSGFQTNSTSLTTNTDSLQATTAHPGGLQTILIGDHSLILTKVNSPTHVDLEDDSMRVIAIPLNDVLIVSKGWMSFTPQSFFDPDYQIEQLGPSTDLDKIDYIYAGDLPEHTVSDQIRTVNFDLSQLPGDKKHLTFILSAPGLDQLKAEYTISGIRFEFHRPALTIGGIFQRMKQRLHL